VRKGELCFTGSLKFILTESIEMSKKKLFFLLTTLVVASMALAGCGGAPANTNHESDKMPTVVFQKGDSYTFHYIPDPADWVKVTYLGDSKWSCESNYGDGTSSCMSTVDATTSFFWGIEKVGEADFNIPGEIAPTQKWDNAKG
jgi:hypothetical protein